MEKEKFYITTAIAYTSKVPHIGNTYEAVLTDALARQKRLEGKDVYFLTGTDEHGQKIQMQAEENGITPKEHVDKIAGEIRRIWDMMDVSYDQFIRTTDDKHKKIVQKIFKKLYKKGDIYKGKYEGHYCVPCESFFTESQLEDGNCPDCGRKVEQASEEAYFFKLSKYTDGIRKFIEENVEPKSRRNEMINNFIEPGLKDLCVSRTSFDWGVPVTIDDGHVVYVWLDALTNYISAIGYDPDGENEENFKKYWPANLHVIGKDIVRFHSIYWPAFLLALGEELPKKVFGHPWLMLGEGKMSKSKGNVLYAQDLVDEFGVEPVRYFLLSEMPYDNDGVITHKLMIEKVNAELANVLGNLVNRTITMVEKYFDGIIPEPKETEDLDRELIELALSTKENVQKKMDELKTSNAAEEIMTFLRRTNKYIDQTEPWVLGKDESKKDRLGTILYNLLESIRIGSILLTPFIPKAAKEIQKQINAKNTSYDSLNGFDGTVNGDSVNKPSPIFQRIDKAKKLKEIEEKMAKKKAKIKKKEKKKGKKEEKITFNQFKKVKMKVAKIIEAGKIKKADKLLKFKVDIDGEQRSVVSGLAKYYKPEELVGKKVLFVSNLEPAKLMGVLSEGMFLTTVEDDKIKLIEIDETVPTGTMIE